MDQFDSDRDSLVHPWDPVLAIGLLTRFPTPRVDDDVVSARRAAASWAWPLAGMAVALLSAFCAAVAMRFGIAPAGAALVAIGVSTAATGALHEDGLADCADGFWGGATSERRLEIMADSRIGVFGTLALVLSVSARWWALSTIFAAGGPAGPLVAAAMLSRAPMAVVMAVLPAARPGGLSHGVGTPLPRAAALGVLLACVGAILAVGPAAGLRALLWAAAASWATAFLAKRKISGQTGDALGMTQQAAETAALFALAAGAAAG